MIRIRGKTLSSGLLVCIMLAAAFALSFAPSAKATSSSQSDQVTNAASLTGLLPESTQRVFQNSRGTMADYVFYSTLGASGTCRYAYSNNGIAWTRDQSTTLAGLFRMCSIAYREDSAQNRTILYLVGSKSSDGAVGSSHDVVFNIGIIMDNSSSISWVNSTPQTLFSVSSTQATEYPVVIIDAKGYLLVAFSFVNDAPGTNNDMQNVVVCGSSTRLPTSNPSWTCSSVSKSCTVGTNCPFGNSGANEPNIRDAKYMPQLIPNVYGFDALVIRGTCEGSESVTCHGQNTNTEASNTVTWTGTTLSFGSTPAAFNLETSLQDPADERSATIFTSDGRVFLAYGNGTSGPIGGSQVIWRFSSPPYSSWTLMGSIFARVHNKGIHLTADGNQGNVLLFYTVSLGSIDVVPLFRGSETNVYSNATSTYWPSSPMIINNATNTKNIVFSVPIAWVNQATTPELWFGQSRTNISPHSIEETLGEASIAVNPTNLRNLIYAGYFSSPRSPFLYSSDAGTTWSNASYPICTALCAYYDEQSAFDTNGNVFIFPHQRIVSGTTIGEYTMKSTDQGHSYSDLLSPVWTNTTEFRFPNGSMETPCSNGGTGFFDYPKLAVDKSSLSRFKNSLYVTTRLMLPIPGSNGYCGPHFVCTGACAWYAGFARSTDGGTTWTAQQVIGDAGGLSDNIGIAINGTIYRASVAGASFSSGTFGGCNGDGVNGVTLQKSTDGGVSFTWSCAYLNTAVIVGPTSHFEAVASAVDATKVWVSFQAVPAGATTYHVFTISSSDAGATWTGPVRVDNGPVNNPGRTASLPAPSMSSSTTGRLDLEWYDFRNAPDVNYPDVYYSYSTDGGNTWAPNVRLTPHTAFWCPNIYCGPGNDFLSVISVGNTAYATYSTDLNGDGLLDGQITTIEF